MRFNQLILPAGIVIGGVVVGFFFELVVCRWLIKVARRTKWSGDDVIIRSLRGWVVVLFTILGLQVALSFLPVSSVSLRTLYHILFVLAVFSISAILARMTAGFINLYGEKGKGLLPSASIFALGALVVINSLGVSITPIITTLGLGGLAVALALQDTLANFFAGLHVIFTRQIRTGDYIRLESGEEGYVTDITWRNTAIRQLNNNVVLIPNAKLASAIIVNYDLIDSSMKVGIQVGVSYDSDLEKVEQVTLDVARKIMREVPGGVPDAEPILRFHTFGDFNINFTIFLQARDAVSQFVLRHQFIKELHRRYRQEGIIIPFPIRTLLLPDLEVERRNNILDRNKKV